MNQTDVLPSSCVALLWPLDTVAASRAEQNGGSIVGTAMLMALLLAFAPVALLGGSSTSLMLCLAAVAVLAAVARWELIVTRGASRVRTSGNDRHGNVDHAEVDLVALALLLPIPYAGEVSARLLLRILLVSDASSPSSPSRVFIIRSEPCA